MPISVESRRRRVAGIMRDHPGAEILDVTSKGPDPWVRLSPFYPHGGIPVPMSPGVTGASVEGVWQALKVFANADVDLATLAVTGMKGLKRTVRRYGPVLGHRAGVAGTELLDYRRARRDIYLPAYRWMLEHRARAEVARLAALAARRPVVLLDYNTNGDVDDLSRPLSHAALIARHVDGAWPA
ncbi:hypothetical protein LX16_0718 [Stackebrandtia albiflava]|uniref:Uncharacterized protein n=1 Tax=Stackebrandtia albiflava TaxID=406432 RepID=A0A562VB03_9ACTN|nr:hypothetical protein [Stackebrandtia albiflava]TWJ15021.1 hypothetical protein LX16_0718 [Stackebrandtia albiflava]